MTELSIDSILDAYRTCNDSWWRHVVAIVLPDTLLPSRFLSYIHESYNDFWQREEFGEAVNPSVVRNDNGSYEIIFHSNCSIEIFNIGASKQYACGYFDQVIVHPEIACKGDSSEEMTCLRSLEWEREWEWLIFGFGTPECNPAKVKEWRTTYALTHLSWTASWKNSRLLNTQYVVSDVTYKHNILITLDYQNLVLFT